jgi:hypothetical protein
LIQAAFEPHLAPYPRSHIELKSGRLRFGESQRKPHQISNSPIPGPMLNMSNGHSFLRADSERRPIPDRALATEQAGRSGRSDKPKRKRNGNEAGDRRCKQQIITIESPYPAHDIRSGASGAQRK